MAYHHLYSVVDLSGVPSLALGRVHTRFQNCCAEPFVAEDPSKSGCNVVLLGVDGKDLTPPSLRQLFLDLPDQFAFFGIDTVFEKLTGFCNDKSDPALEFRIELSTVKGPNPVRMIGIQQQRVEHSAQD